MHRMAIAVTVKDYSCNVDSDDSEVIIVGLGFMPIPVAFSSDTTPPAGTLEVIDHFPGGPELEYEQGSLGAFFFF